jgi:hypothetical protein
VVFDDRAGPPIGAIEALKKLRILLFIASKRDDIEAVQEHIEMAQVIIHKALPRTHAGPGH